MADDLGRFTSIGRTVQLVSALLAGRDLTRAEARHPERFQDWRRQFVYLVRGGEKALPEKEGLLSDVVDALQRRRALRLRYHAFDGTRRTVRVEPLSLAVYDHQLYVIARPGG